MELTTILYEIMNSAACSAKEIILVDCMPIDIEEYKSKIRAINEDLEELGEDLEMLCEEGQYKLPRHIKMMTPDEVLNATTLPNNSVILTQAHLTRPPLINLPELFLPAQLYKKISQLAPEAEQKIILRTMLGDLLQHSLRRAMHGTLSSIMTKNDINDFVNSFCSDETPHEAAITGMKYGMKCRPLAYMLESLTGPIRHTIGAEKDIEFKKELSERFSEGNFQTEEEKTFLIISNKFEKLNGKFDVLYHDSDFSQIDFLKYAAVFVDNAYSFKEGSSKLGTGISTLEKLAAQLAALGIDPDANIPIFYQTAHSITAFSKADIDRVQSYPNTFLIPKNIAPKICRTKEQAVKELLIRERIQNLFLDRQSGIDPSMIHSLVKYTAKAQPIGEHGFVQVGEKYITFTRAVNNEVCDEGYKQELFKKLGVQDTRINHKMYVLALFHTYLKQHMHDEKLVPTSKDFFEFSEIEQRIINTMPGLAEPSELPELPKLEARLSALENAYNAIVAKHRSYEPRVLSHNDAKWDNWFKGKVLGDFGSVCPGLEYKDIAKALLVPENDFAFTLNHKDVSKAVNTYTRIRREIDPAFRDNEQPKEFLRNVQDMLVTETLRTVYYKARSKPEMVDGLVRVAEEYLVTNA